MKNAILSVFGGIIVLRFVAFILGCFYGPYIYMVLPLGGLYLTLDIVTCYVIYADEGDVMTDTRSGPSNCKIFSISWCVFNVLGIIGLLVAIGFFCELGFWSMAYQPIHLALFVIIICLVILLAMQIGLLCSYVRRKQDPYRVIGH